MSAWRREALQQLPELRPVIERAESPMSLWIELYQAFCEAFVRDDQKLIARFLRYARWCWSSSDADTRTAVALAFYEHVADHSEMRPLIPRWFSFDEFKDLRSVFEYHAGAEAIALVEKAYR